MTKRLQNNRYAVPSYFICLYVNEINSSVVLSFCVCLQKTWKLCNAFGYALMHVVRFILTIIQRVHWYSSWKLLHQKDWQEPAVRNIRILIKASRLTDWWISIYLSAMFLLIHQQCKECFWCIYESLTLRPYFKSSCFLLAKTSYTSTIAKDAWMLHHLICFISFNICFLEYWQCIPQLLRE